MERAPPGGQESDFGLLFSLTSNRPDASHVCSFAFLFNLIYLLAAIVKPNNQSLRQAASFIFRYEQLSYELWSLPHLLGGFQDKGSSDHFVTAGLVLFTGCTTIKAATFDL